MINKIWLFLIVSGVLVSVIKGTTEQLSAGIVENVSSSVEVIMGLVGVMALWTGIMRVAEEAGLVKKISEGIRPLLKVIFPEVPPNHPAMGAMVMNITANMLGLGNAATPLGINAMKELQRLNPHPPIATNAMCTFLVINTSSVQLVPATVIGLRAATGSANPSEIVGTALIATTVSTLVGITCAKVLQRFY